MDKSTSINISLDSMDCSKDEIRREISHVKTNSFAGPDGILSVLLKTIAPSIITPTVLVF